MAQRHEQRPVARLHILIHEQTPRVRIRREDAARIEDADPAQVLVTVQIEENVTRYLNRAGSFTIAEIADLPHPPARRKSPSSTSPIPRFAVPYLEIYGSRLYATLQPRVKARVAALPRFERRIEASNPRAAPKHRSRVCRSPTRAPRRAEISLRGCGRKAGCGRGARTRPRDVPWPAHPTSCQLDPAWLSTSSTSSHSGS